MSRKIAITGASSEIGLAICQTLLSTEDTILLHCYKNSQKLSAALSPLFPQIQIETADFSNPEQLKPFLRHLTEVDILINAAAVTITETLPNLTDEEILQMLFANNYALAKTCQAVIPGMLVKRSGLIINISSIVATRGNRGQSVYAGTKGFIESFTRSIAAEYGKKGIRANCVAPGPIESGSLKGLLSYAPEEVKKSLASKRLGTPQDVAALVGFLCREEASFINGKTIGVDGGFMQGV